jgi:hypothetical protein
MIRMELAITKWAKQSEHGVRSFGGWIQGINDAALDRIHTVQRDNLLGDGRKEERKKKHKETLTMIHPRQIPIDRFLSLMNRLE